MTLPRQCDISGVAYPPAYELVDFCINSFWKEESWMLLIKYSLYVIGLTNCYYYYYYNFMLIILI